MINLMHLINDSEIKSNKQLAKKIFSFSNEKKNRTKEKFWLCNLLDIYLEHMY